MGLAGKVTRNAGARELAAEEADLLRYGRVVDTTRLRERFGYEPRYTTETAVASFLRSGRPVPRLGLAAVGVGSDVLQARGVRARRAVTGA